MVWDDIGFVLKSKKRKQLLFLLEKPRTPTQLSKLMESSLPNVSMKLNDMSKKGLVKCINPADTKGRIFVLTERGKEIVKKIQEMES